MNTNVPDLAITGLETITAFDVTTGAFKFSLDDLQNATISQTQDSVEITGKQGRRISTLKRNKAVTISGTNGLLSTGLAEQQTGGVFEHKVTPVKWTDYLTVESNSATTSFVAVGTAGAEIETVYLKDSEGVLSTQFTQASTAAAGKFTYDPETKVLGFYAGDLADGSEIVVFYTRNITADVLSNASDQYTTKCALYIDALAEDACANVYRVQFYIPKADFSGEFSWEFGDNQAVHDFEAEALAGACGTSGAFFTYTIFGVNAADAE